MFTPTPTKFFFYEPQRVPGQEELGLVVMLCLTGLGIIYLARVALSEKKSRNENE